MKPLEGVKVLDMSRILAGPWCTQLLADLGADVVKVERPGLGDDTRQWGPPYLERNGARVSAFYLACNRGKRSIAIDLSRTQDQALIRELASVSDVLVENFKVGDLAKYGLDSRSLRALFPDLIYCSITGFGQNGPYATEPGYDFIIQAMGGLMSVTGAPDGEPGAGPMKVGVATADIMTGLYACSAILGALLNRQRTGEGIHIDISMLDVQVATLANQAMSFLVSGHSPIRLGNAAPAIVPYGAFPTSDGHIVLAAANDGQFRRLCRVLALEQLAEDERYASNAARVEHRSTLTTLLNAHFSREPTSFWITQLKQAGIGAAPINDLAAVFADEHVRFRQMQGELTHPVLGPTPTVACPIRFDGASATSSTAPPGLGDDNRAVKADWLGRSDPS